MMATHSAEVDDSDNSDISFPEIILVSIPSPGMVPTNMNVQVAEAKKCFEGVTFQAPTEDMLHQNDFLLPVMVATSLRLRILTSLLIEGTTTP